MKATNRLGEEKITKLLIDFSVPATVGMLVNALYNIVDRMYIGNSPDLGALGLAGITISFPLTLIIMAIAMLFGTGGGTMFSIKLGEKKPEEAEGYLGNATTLLIVSSVIYMVLGIIFLKPLLRLFGASPLVTPYAVEYMQIVLWGSVLQGLSMGLNNFIRADGRPKIAMITMFLGAGFNIVFDPIFIYVFRWGMTGAALATVGGQMLTTIWILFYFIGGKSTIKLKLEAMKPNFDYIKRIVQIGAPSFLRQIANSILNILLNKGLFTYGGDIALSGMGVINSIQTFVIMPVFGITQGLQPILGYNFGAKKIDRVKEGLKLGVYMATIIVTFGWVITRLFPGAIVRLFSSDAELIDFGGRALMIWFLCLPFVGFQVVSASYFQAVGKARAATFLTASRQLIILIPALLILPKFFGLYGILYAAPLADAISSIITGAWLWVDIKTLKLQYQENKPIIGES